MVSTYPKGKPNVLEELNLQQRSCENPNISLDVDLLHGTYLWTDADLIDELLLCKMKIHYNIHVIPSMVLILYQLNTVVHPRILFIQIHFKTIHYICD